MLAAAAAALALFAGPSAAAAGTVDHITPVDTTIAGGCASLTAEQKEQEVRALAQSLGMDLATVDVAASIFECATARRSRRQNGQTATITFAVTGGTSAVAAAQTAVATAGIAPVVAKGKKAKKAKKGKKGKDAKGKKGKKGKAPKVGKQMLQTQDQAEASTTTSASSMQTGLALIGGLLGVVGVAVGLRKRGAGASGAAAVGVPEATEKSPLMATPLPQLVATPAACQRAPDGVEP